MTVTCLNNIKKFLKKLNDNQHRDMDKKITGHRAQLHYGSSKDDLKDLKKDVFFAVSKLLVISGANGFDYLRDTEVIGKFNILPLDANHLNFS